MLRITTVLTISMASFVAYGQEIHEEFPQTIDPAARYVIYSHGLIVEGDDPMPVHPSFGVYDFPAIKEALFHEGGFHLIAHQRPANTDPATYAKTLESWVRRLVDAGVAPMRITLVGFSRGGQLTAHASSRLEDVGINTALLATCVDGTFRADPPLSLGGNFLSIYETTDVPGSCKGLAAASEGLVSFEEIAISTGRRHGAFYQPLADWIDPLKDWIRRTNH